MSFTCSITFTASPFLGKDIGKNSSRERNVTSFDSSYFVSVLLISKITTRWRLRSGVLQRLKPNQVQDRSAATSV